MNALGFLKNCNIKWTFLFPLFERFQLNDNVVYHALSPTIYSIIYTKDFTVPLVLFMFSLSDSRKISTFDLPNERLDWILVPQCTDAAQSHPAPLIYFTTNYILQSYLLLWILPSKWQLISPLYFTYNQSLKLCLFTGGVGRILGPYFRMSNNVIWSPLMAHVWELETISISFI